MVARRQIIRIDEEKCDGCGLCVPACAEGAIQVIDGKARLVSETFCDGLGACLGECPRGAITLEEREAPPFDAHAVEMARGSLRRPAPLPHGGGGCPGTLARRVVPASHTRLSPNNPSAADRPSALGNWPVQLHLLPTRAPYFADAHLLIAADCV
ncbi:MAG: 4Fe-4S binding protein, partial [Armatimonadota bacterium]|nr:4Fe-4S binding protein [Armatimonadota bacterium]